MYLQTNPSADLPCLLSQVPLIQPSPFALSISFTLPFSSLQVVEALERAQRRYKLEERPTAPGKTAVKVVTGRNAPFCYYLSADQALTVSIACSPGLIIGTETCKTRLAFEYNTPGVAGHHCRPEKIRAPSGVACCHAYCPCRAIESPQACSGASHFRGGGSGRAQP
jgi:hypothetical protein